VDFAEQLPNTWRHAKSLCANGSTVPACPATSPTAPTRKREFLGAPPTSAGEATRRPAASLEASSSYMCTALRVRRPARHCGRLGRVYWIFQPDVSTPRLAVHQQRPVYRSTLGSTHPYPRG
jgi:hypothetical protein